MKLPGIDQSNRQINKTKHPSLLKQKHKIITEQNNSSPTFKSNSLLSRMKEIKEIKIYLKEKFLKTKIDEQFLKNTY